MQVLDTFLPFCEFLFGAPLTAAVANKTVVFRAEAAAQPFAAFLLDNHEDRECGGQHDDHYQNYRKCAHQTSGLPPA
jgi:hypothetical protein